MLIVYLDFQNKKNYQQNIFKDKVRLMDKDTQKTNYKKSKNLIPYQINLIDDGPKS